MSGLKFPKPASRASVKLCLRCSAAIPQEKPSRTNQRKYCSTTCAYAAFRAANPARTNPCCICGRLLGGRAPRLGATCSKRCGYENRKRRTRPPRNCDHCGTEYWTIGKVRSRFCSIQCYNAVRNRRPALMTVQCANCGANVIRTAAAVKRVEHTFCGRACSVAYQRGSKHHSYRGDKDPNRGADWNRLADTIRERDCYSCRRCGLCQTGNGEKLSVDHVRPWRTFTDKSLANHPDNLVALCRPCHSMKTQTVEAAWLRGDVLPWKKFVASLSLPSAKFGWCA